MSADIGYSSPKQGSSRLEQLRTAFDQAFASAPGTEAEPLVSLIAIRLAGQPAVIPAEHILGLAKVKRIIPLPSSIPELIGIAGIRGALIPVFDLARLVGLGSPASQPIWLVLANRESPIGLAFDEFEGRLEVPPAAVCSEERSGGSKNLALLARVKSSVRVVTDVPGVVEAIRKSARLERAGRTNRT